MRGDDPAIAEDDIVDDGGGVEAVEISVVWYQWSETPVL